MTLLTRANPEQEAKLRALIRGDSAPAKPKAPKRTTKPATVYVEPTVFGCYDREGNSLTRLHTITVQIALRLERDQYNAGGGHWLKAKTAKQHIETTLLALRTGLRPLSANRYERERIRSMTLVRISPARLGDDNLVSAFKHVRDAACAWLHCGDDDFDRRTIGRFDDDVNQPGGLQCTYEQTTCARDKRAHGIQIRFSM